MPDQRETGDAELVEDGSAFRVVQPGHVLQDTAQGRWVLHEGTEVRQREERGRAAGSFRGGWRGMHVPDGGHLDGTDGEVVPLPGCRVRVAECDGPERRIAHLRTDTHPVVGGPVDHRAGRLRDPPRVTCVIEMPVPDKNRLGCEVSQILRSRGHVPGAGQPRHPRVQQEDRPADGHRIRRAPHPRQHHPIGAHRTRCRVDGVGSEEPLPSGHRLRGRRFSGGGQPSCRQQNPRSEHATQHRPPADQAPPRNVAHRSTTSRNASPGNHFRRTAR
ncbi:hypothetical protein NONI108955_24495 [Nocardia ninae]